MGPSARVLSFLLAASIASTITSALPQPRWNDEWLNLTVIHTNDVHSRVDPANTVGVSCNSEDIASGHCYGGTARHKTVIDGLRKANKNSLLLDGGDEVRFFFFGL
jgi:5'-nucleotidase